MAESLRTHIVNEIRRLASAGKPPGQILFGRETSIREHEWRGVFWTRWSEALTEAGYQPNDFTARFDTADVLRLLVEACRHFGHVPNQSEMMLYRRSHGGFPSKGAIAGHFPRRTALLRALADYVARTPSCSDIEPMLPAFWDTPAAVRTS